MRLGGFYSPGDRKGQLATLKIFLFLSPGCPSVGGEMPNQLYYSTFVLFRKGVEKRFLGTEGFVRLRASLSVQL